MNAPSPPSASTSLSSSLPRAPTADAIDAAFRAALGKLTGGLSPTAFAGAWLDWTTQLAASPARQLELATDFWRRGAEVMTYAVQSSVQATTTAAAAEAPNADPWSQYPFNVYSRAFEEGAAWLRSLPTEVDGLEPRHAALVEFTVRQWLDALSPTNFLATNPELLALTRAQGGDNLMRGARHLVEDLGRTMKGKGPVGTESFEVGQAVAATPGKVIYRNELIELLQYSPTTPDVYAEPVLIVPAWIMKYYILDLSPRNSLVRYLVEQGHTVYMVSWRNPTAEHRDLGMDDYLTLGITAALDAIETVQPGRRVHATGYCIGGTLLAIAAADLARRHDTRLASVTLFAAQTDFSEPGELSLFINPHQLALLKSQMHQEGVLDSRQMGGAFQMLRPRELIWQPMVQSYLKGQRDPMIDLMAWNADGTRMPYRMHTEYLYRLYLDNELATGRFPVQGTTVQLADVTVPMFVVGTETDHVAPWRSVYKVGGLVRSSDYTFLLTSGGHNAGIISGPVHPKRRHRVHTDTAAGPRPSADNWLSANPPQAGSWWPVWQRWLAERAGPRVAPPGFGAPQAGLSALEDAPGQYVRG